jgi:fatty acid desaturase
MSEERPPIRPERVEWRTIALISGWFAAMAVVIGLHASIPWWLSVPALALLGGLHFSLQHEAIHGHPTPWRRLDTALVGVPLALWCPFPVYRESHLAHHRSDLTVPGVDPESYYVSAADWQRSGAFRRGILRANRTLLGRITLGPWLVIQSAGQHALGSIRTPGGRRVWSAHVALAAMTVGVIVGLVGLPWWEYLLGLVWGGTAVTLVRSFVEHRAVDGERSATVVSNRFVGLIYLNNNLHVTHHAYPGAPWYRIPELHRRSGGDEIARAGAGWYPGYGQVARRYFVRPFDTAVHPDELHLLPGGVEHRAVTVV